MKILTIGSDRKLFEEGSAVLARQMKYAKLVDKTDIIVYSQKKLNLLTTNYCVPPKLYAKGDNLPCPSEALLCPSVAFGEGGCEGGPTNLTIYPTNSISRFLYFIDAVRIARTLDKPDIVSSQDPFESGVASYLISRYFGVPLHLQAHTDFFSPYFYQGSLLNKIRFFLAYFLIIEADSVRVVSERIKQSIVRAGLKSEDKITVLPVFVDTDKIKNSIIKTDLHKKYRQFDFIILMASRITKEKNIGLAISAMKEIVARHPRVGLIIVGDGPEKKNYELRIKNYGLERNIIMEDWSNDLPSYYKTADLFLLTSNYEGYGMTVVEALSAGLPVAMSDVGIAGEVIINDKNGLIFPVGDIAGLISALDRFISDKNFRGLIKNNISRMDLNMTEEKYLELYRQSL